jgi:hypothetical protein
LARFKAASLVTVSSPVEDSLFGLLLLFCCGKESGDIRERAVTETPKKSDAEHKVTEAGAHIKSAPILKALQKRIGRHPEIGAAIYEAGNGAG